MGIESSSCQMTSISRYWTKILPIFEAIIEQPTFSPADLKLARLNQETQLKSKTEDPSYYANEMLNTIFYGKQHPYFMPTATQLKLLPQVKRSHIRKLHSQLVKQIDAITIVSSLPTDEIHKRLNRHFGDIQPAKIVAPKVPKPGQGDRKDFIFAHRKIPTAYIRIKFPMPGVHAEDFQAANLMTSILDEELSLEIRTKRSLSYAVFSYMIKYSQGIGVIGASTSKPQQTIAAISQVIKRIKQKKYTEDELAKFKTVYTTSYFLKLEDHGSLASTISRYWFYDQSTDPLYESPLGLAAVSSQEVQTMAQRYLANFKMAVVFDKTRFETDWAQTFLKEHKTSAH
jgi:predicted Zn-dependent peptidase